MRIRKIRLTNGYKRFKDLTIDLGNQPPKIVALVGPNGCGKSSVLDGMLYLQAAYRQIGESNVGNWTYHSMEGNSSFDQNRMQHIQISFDIGDFNQVAQLRGQTGTQATMIAF